MSFLAWAFGLGALAVAFPLIFHLIRRTPKGRQEFSSLMFLRPSPPRLTRRSRLDNLLLLLLRAAVVTLLAIAFMRPFFREQVNLISADVPARRVAILMDTSASMKAGNLWKDACKEARSVIAKLEPTDDVALFTFDDEVKTIIDFENEIRVASSQKYQLIRSEIDKIQPTFKSTRLASALVNIADSMDIANESSENAAALQIVLISDMQDGSLIDSLQSFQWPKSVRVDVRPIKSSQTNNASVHVLNPARQKNPEMARVRVTNAANSKINQFYAAFSNQNQIDQETAVPFYVPPGTSRVLQLPRKITESDRVVLRGDKVDFDNQHFVIPTQQRKTNIAYFGDEDSEDANSMLYYLERAFTETPQLRVDFQQISGDKTTELNKQTELVIVTKPLTAGQQAIVKKHLENRGTLLIVLSDLDQLKSDGELMGSPSRVDPDPTQPKRKYSLIAQIDFEHPLIMPLANPRYNDFTKIHFWKHVSVKIPDSDKTQVIASFDDDTPAIWQSKYGTGNVFTFAAGWDPPTSQLALDADKFIPIMSTLLRLASRSPVTRSRYIINDAIDFPKTDKLTNWKVVRPDQKTEVIASDQRSYKNTDIPGIYEMTSPEFTEQKFKFAVNIASTESQTAPMPIEKLKMHNVLIGKQDTRTARIQQLQKLKDREIENRQKIWKWLVVFAFAFLLLETWLAGRKNWKTSPASQSQMNPSVVTS